MVKSGEGKDIERGFWRGREGWWRRDECRRWRERFGYLGMEGAVGVNEG
jgi:hypothetical protein